MVEDALHLHGGPGVGDAEHGAGHQALQGRGAVRGSDQTPVGPLMAALQDLHSLAAADRQLVAVAGHEVVNHHGKLAATRQLRRTGRGRSSSTVLSLCKMDQASSVSLSVCVCACVPYRCLVCSARCGMPERWCLAGCCLRPDYPGLLHP